MTSMTIRQRILACFAVILSLVMVMGTVFLLHLGNIGQATLSVQAKTLPRLKYASQIRRAQILRYTLTQEFVLQPTEAGRRHEAEGLGVNETYLTHWISLYETTLSTPAERAQFDVFKLHLRSFDTLQSEVQKMAAAPSTRAAAIAKLVDELDPVFDELDAVTDEMVDSNQIRTEQSEAQVLDTVAAARVSFLVIMIVALALSFLCGFYLLRAITLPLRRLVRILDLMRQGDYSQRLDLVRRDEFGALAVAFNAMTDELVRLVETSGMQVNTSVTEIAATARQQQVMASEVSTTTIELGATSREISATSKELVRTMHEVSAVAEQTAGLAGSSQVGLTHMEATMRQVMEAAGSINSKLIVLNEKAGNIGQVVTTITKVADRTNLLSLNAAIESEKAGEYGRGFSVVAMEIRRLADQTAVSTYEIEQMIHEIQSAISAGVMGMDKFADQVHRSMQAVHQVGAQLSQIIHQVQALAPRFEAVNEGMQAQTEGAEQITQALAQLGTASKQTVESFHQSNVAIDELRLVASALSSDVSRFKVKA